MAGFGVLINIRFHNLYLSSGTGRNWSGLTFRFATFLSLPIPATAQAPTLPVMPIMIQFPTNTADNSDYIQNVSTIISDRVSKWKPSDLFITKIDNWFDDKWVKFSGTIMHEISIWKSEVTVPPFHPNRVDSSEFYKLENGDYLKQENKSPLHIRQESTKNLKRKITDFSTNGLFIWYSGNTKTNDKGSVMGYLVTEDECFTFYLSLDQHKNWDAERAIGLTTQEIQNILSKELRVE